MGVAEYFARKATKWTGSSWAFGIASLTILIWGLTGPLFHYSDTWQLVINTGTTIVTFLMVFLIQRAQNNDSQAVHLKLNEIVASIKGASNRLISVEDLSEDQIGILAKRYQEMTARSKKDISPTESHTVEEEDAGNSEKKSQR
jgi:low affinity Fe/Cu permease